MGGMRLSKKLTIALVLGICAVMACYAYFEVRQEIVLTQADLMRAQRVGLAWMGTIEAVWQREGPARARELAMRAMQRAEDITLRILPLTAGAAPSGRPFSTGEFQTLLAGKVVRRTYSDETGYDWRQIYVPLRVSDGEEAVVEYAEPMEGEERFIKMSHLGLTVATLAVIAACALIATGLEYWLVGRPLQLLRDKARRAGEGDFSGPLDLRQNDEMGDLAREINAMCERIATAKQKLAEETEARIAAIDQLRHTDRLATVGQLAAGVAHELGTPLNVISARAELIAAAERVRPDVAQNAHIIGDQCDRMTDIIQQLLDFSRRRGAAMGLTDLRHVVGRTLGLLSTAAEKAQVRLSCAPGDTPVLVCIDQNQMQQALANIVLNGIQAMAKGGSLRVEVRMKLSRPPGDTGVPEADYACVTVEDEGTGIAPAQLQRIFEPFFTTKAVGEGTGLGLAVAHGIVAEHNGWISVDSTLGGGTRFSVFLPVAAGAASHVGVAS
jgi:two-component system NtrC family sensor kinase